jgi:hypothetical protein
LQNVGQYFFVLEFFYGQKIFKVDGRDGRDPQNREKNAPAEGLEDNLEALGEVFLQDQFLVWDPKQLIRKGRERHLFLFDMCLIFAKEVKDSNGRKGPSKSGEKCSRRKVHMYVSTLLTS